MKRPENRLDQHGFPIPPKFDQDPSADLSQKPAGRRGRWVLLALLLLVGGALLVESPLLDAGRHAIGKIYLQQAEQKHFDGDLPGALDGISSALEYLHDEPVLYYLRGRWRLEAKDLEGSLADCSRAIELMDETIKSASLRSKLFIERSFVYQRMGRHREALDDLNLAVKYRTARDSETFNARAYGRALAGVELDDALKDVEKAIGFESPDSPALPSFLDTRGYIQFLLGHYDSALKDLNQAIEKVETDLEHYEKLSGLSGPNKRLVALEIKHQKETLGVMYHHRGQTQEKLGDAAQAKSDLKRGDELGYNPAEGVF